MLRLSMPRFKHSSSSYTLDVSFKCLTENPNVVPSMAEACASVMPMLQSMFLSTDLEPRSTLYITLRFLQITPSLNPFFLVTLI